MATTMRSNYSALFGTSALPVLEELFMGEYDSAPSVRDMLFRTVHTDQNIWQSQDINDLPLLAAMSEGDTYTYNKPTQGGSKTFTPAKKGGGFQVTKEIVADARFDVIGSWARKLGKAAKATREIAAVNVYNNAFSSELAQDGLSVINAAHEVDATTFSNVITGNPDLSVSSLQAALSQFETAFISGQGVYNHITPRILVVHPDNKRYAMELTMSENRPDTGDNNMNSLRHDGLTVVSSPYLTDSDAWFLQGAPEDTGLIIVEREGIVTSASGIDAGFHTDSTYFKCSYREAVGVSRAQGILGSAGA